MLFSCSACGRKQHAPDEFAGEPVQCGACGRVQVIVRPIGNPSEHDDRAMAPRVVAPPPPRHAPIKPPRPDLPRQEGWYAWLRSGILDSSQVQAVACALIVLSFLDFFMTYTLLRAHPMFYESNPVAHWFFERWNVVGLIAFKFTVLGGAIALSEFIERCRRGWGRLVLWIGCLGTAYAVCKGVTLYLE
jgi:hypothetical protein